MPYLVSRKYTTVAVQIKNKRFPYHFMFSVPIWIANNGLSGWKIQVEGAFVKKHSNWELTIQVKVSLGKILKPKLPQCIHWSVSM